MVEPVETVLKAIQGITEYIPAMQELFACTPEVNVDKELDYQATLQWGWSLPKKETQNRTSRFILTEIPDFAKEISKLIIDPLQTLTAFDIDFGRIKEVKLKDFLSLDQEKYVNDEVMNYFCVKWTRRRPTKRVIALTTFFSAKVLFEHGNLRGEVYDRLSEDSLKYCKAAKACLVSIKFSCQSMNRVDTEIFDSWGATYEKNSGRDIKDQKHAPLMLVLMWAAELWSSICGVEPMDKPTVLLRDNKDSGWTFNPHALVAFQDNCFDCGIHVLDHLDRILRGENLNRKDKPSMDHHHRLFLLECLLLAQELYDDAKSPTII
ncbi:hypothetical protein BT96DRAFT_949272 [Gymnopus androsaceus JB14]|uniref:Ubiquitin-like protease family profile domain-containing protein n=1 Tax=Gymnopus androsaceus JB14 TaxID=1447944 RepID=A0A6A4GM01_9AGAR|nr:hypothetical protein BT96DRAFT_949272 [Gymnopus androsaceus JB14]